MGSGGANGGSDYAASMSPPPPPLVFFPPHTPSTHRPPRRLSGSFSGLGRRSPAARKQPACRWMTVQGLAVDGGGAAPPPVPAAACEDAFRSLHCALVVSAAAALGSKGAQKIDRLQRSIHLRDQLLSSMQQKFDDLRRQMSNASMKDGGVLELHRESGILPIGVVLNKNELHGIEESGRDETTLKDSSTFFAEPEERRMSDLSDLYSNSSSLDIQLSTLAAEQDYYNIRKECEEKDTTIRELSSVIHTASVSNSKRVMELEDIIKRKNLVISKMKKDMLVLEQQVIKLMRLRRPSCATPDRSSNIPVMTANLVYDMSSTSPSSSSSDSDSFSERAYSSQDQVYSDPIGEDCAASSENPKKLSLSDKRRPKPADRARRRWPVGSPLEAACVNRSADSTLVSKTKQMETSHSDIMKISRRISLESKATYPRKRWV